ncbi:MAG: hypothetical protein F6K48_03415 [Okeania sp. SIO3H1]|nr:hypothetical protein [Okeania sp. SIO3H1]
MASEEESELFYLHDEICALMRKKKRLLYYLKKIRDEMQDKGYDPNHFVISAANEAIGGDE